MCRKGQQRDGSGTDGKSYQLEEERKTEYSSESYTAMCQTSLPSPGIYITLLSPNFALFDKGQSCSTLTRNQAHSWNYIKKQQEACGKIFKYPAKFTAVHKAQC